MTPETANAQQAKQREFMSLLPLTLELAGLPKSQPGAHFTDGQMEVRVSVIRNAYKLARQLVIDISKPAESAG
ncbi:hypothetical protein KIH39_12040 [Telmatocola sphagniphila]|jgi:hypothetical protein|uniref:Uncharacterized protein n=1 Tax=Telmatocola sphagniphila TaxID=1123043 RepID=A0A8E6F0J2_9BACT|nr:hypothetical protein [Telmatocola sphagniphila]QVL34601.1 hypothetical protein KIH39_12040 [Telmatocola sphagniphila]